jgi:hypothetical protein
MMTFVKQPSFIELDRQLVMNIVMLELLLSKFNHFFKCNGTVGKGFLLFKPDSDLGFMTVFCFC